MSRQAWFLAGVLLLATLCQGLDGVDTRRDEKAPHGLGHTKPADTQAFGRVLQLEDELQRSLRRFAGLARLEGAAALQSSRELLRTVNLIMEGKGISSRFLRNSMRGSLQEQDSDGQRHEEEEHSIAGDIYHAESAGRAHYHAESAGGKLHDVEAPSGFSKPRGINSPVVLEPEMRRLAEDVRLSKSRRIVLNQLDYHNKLTNRLRISCTKGLSSMKAFQALPACPNFKPCKGYLTSRTGEENKAIALHKPVLEDGDMEVCSSGYSDPDGYYGPVPPRNCHSWYNMDKGEKHELLSPWLNRGESLGHAKTWMLLRRPELGCAHRSDFVFHSPVTYSVYKLRGVYISAEAVVFNRTTTFLRLGCRDGVHVNIPDHYPTGSVMVQHVGAVLNWAYRQGSNFYHSLIESFPMFMSFGPILNQQRDLPLLAFWWQFKTYGTLLAPLVGVPLEKLRRYEIDGAGLVHADTVYQPVYQYCGRLSRGLWTAMRSRHLLHPQGIPLFNPDWSMRHTQPLTSREMKRYPEDWVVVLAKRPGTERALNGSDELLKTMRRMLSPKRVVLFSGGLDILQARDLFRRTRLFVGVHGASLANMIFMPAQASVVEIRPDAYQKNCFHSLADACSLQYNLLIGKGTKAGRLYIDINKVVNLISYIAHEYR